MPSDLDSEVAHLTLKPSGYMPISDLSSPSLHRIGRFGRPVTPFSAKGIVALRRPANGGWPYPRGQMVSV